LHDDDCWIETVPIEPGYIEKKLAMRYLLHDVSTKGSNITL